MSESIARHLADNVRQLRAGRGLTQVQCAKAAELPRATWSHLESGSANPTLSVLSRAAQALQVSIDELLSPPKAHARLYPAGSLPSRVRRGTRVSQLLPDTIGGLQFERLEMDPNAGRKGLPHTPGTREYLTCETGQITLIAGGETWRLGPGDVVVFQGDQKHSYRNELAERSVGYSIVAFAGVQD